MFSRSDTRQAELVSGLQKHLFRIRSATPADAGTAQITELLTAAIEEYALRVGGECVREYRLGVFPYRTARATHTSRKADVDLAVAGLCDLPILIEIDRTDKSWSLEKLMHGHARGHPAIWVRWGGPGFKVTLPVPDGVDLIKVVVPSADVWEPDRQRRYPERRKLPSPEMIPSPCEIRYVDPSTLLSDEERRARDERVSKRTADHARKKAQRRSRRRKAGITRGTPINTPAGSGYERTTRPPGPDR